MYVEAVCISHVILSPYNEILIEIPNSAPSRTIADKYEDKRANKISC